jgi:hypothetical protein
MKKVLIGFLALLVVFLLWGVPSAQAVTDDEVQSQHIQEADGTSGQDTNTGSGIKTGHIQNDAVTAQKIKNRSIAARHLRNNAVIKSKIADRAVIPSKIGFYSNVIIVAPSGGDYTSPVDAMNSITDASATNPYLVKIMPGVYDIGTNSVQMKPYVDIEGSGEVTTKITGTVSSDTTPPTAGVVNGSDNVEIRFLTVENTGTGYLKAAIYNNNASPKITHIIVTVSGGNHSYGVYNSLSSSPTMTNVTVTVNALGGDFSYGVYNQSSSSTMTNVTVNASGGINNYGVVNNFSSPTMRDVTVNASGGNHSYGVYNDSSSPTMRDVTAVGKDGVSTNYGMYNYGTSGTIYVDRSSFEGITNSIFNCPGFTLYIGASKLAGGAANTNGTYHCVGAYNENYTTLDSSCQ